MDSTTHIKKFGASTSMHGASRFILTKSPTRRRLWLMIFLASWAMFIGQMYLVCGKYFEYPKRVVVDVTDGGVPFPWITICNMNGFDFHLVHRLREVFNTSTGINHTLLRNSSVDQFIRKYSELYIALRSEKSKHNNTQQFLFSKDLWQANIPREMLSDVSIKFKEFFVSCKYKRKECRYSEDVLLHFNWYYFNCFRYTGAKGHEDQGTNYPPLNEGISEGWTAIVLAGRGMLGKRKEGERSIPGVHETARSTGGSEGIRVVIHPPNTMAFPMTEGYDVPPGYSASLAFRPGVVKRIGKPYGECFDNTKARKIYRETLCMNVCHENVVRKRCGCTDSRLPHRMGIDTNLEYFLKHSDPSQPDDLKSNKCRKNTTEIASSTCRYCRHINLDPSVSSIDRVSEYANYTKCMEDVKSELSRDLTTHNCGCLPPCHRYTYVVTYSLSKWPSTGYEGLGIWSDIFEVKKFVDNFNDTESEHKLYSDYIQSNGLNVLEDFSRINVFVRDSSVMQTTEGPDYLLFQLLSDVGGQLGIWIGVSVITVTEVFEMIFLMTRNTLCRTCNQSKTAKDDLEEAQSECDWNNSAMQGDQIKSSKEAETLENIAE